VAEPEGTCGGAARLAAPASALRRGAGEAGLAHSAAPTTPDSQWWAWTTSKPPAARTIPAVSSPRYLPRPSKSLMLLRKFPIKYYLMNSDNRTLP